ncbi:MAG TPA: hypothetical protein VEB40_05955 [Flavipsychrobacter sp.]|nr:hypothetical protein [Flavipsychrobacter sp.]
MKRITLFITFCLLVQTAVTAQNKSGSASQAASLVLNNSIDISYMATGDGTGNDAIMQFSTPADYSNGVTSPEQLLRVRSNKNFKVAVRCDASSFAYQGGDNNTIESMPDNALWLKVTANNTGGAVKAPFSTSGYATLSEENQDLLVNGNYGGNQTFSVQYKCTPGFNLPAGTYTMNVVFTATQE